SQSSRSSCLKTRPEITILSAEPLTSTSWFPGASGGFPPPPPPPAQIWGPTIPPPPPTYEEVIREKTQEQVLSTSSSASASPLHPVSRVTISTQTDPGSDPDPPEPQGKRFFFFFGGGVCKSCDLTDLGSPSTSNSGVQTDQWDQCSATVDQPRPRPRSKPGLRPISSEVKVQTLVKLREDGLATLASRAASDPANQQVTQGKYSQELLEAFSSDEWGFPDNRGDTSGLSQSESEEGEDEDDWEDMATLKARIQAFEQQQQQQVSSESCDGNDKQSGTTKRPEPRPRPRFQGQQAKSGPPTIAPKPKNFSPGPKPSTKGFWEDGGFTAATEDSTEAPSSKPQTTAEPSLKSAPGLEPQPIKPTEKPTTTPKPQSSTETLSSAPVPAPRPPPPKLTPCLSDPKPPPRPPVTPRVSVGVSHPDKSTTDGRTTPTLTPRPLVEVGGGSQTETQTGSEATQSATNQSGEFSTQFTFCCPLQVSPRNYCSCYKQYKQLIIVIN
uniref:Uncharacterized protein n=1 Tax=Astatotilapia calliptera TaxID=8154 RepID=A0AAX7T3X4_ASTCA